MYYTIFFDVFPKNLLQTFGILFLETRFGDLYAPTSKFGGLSRTQTGCFPERAFFGRG